MNMTCPTCDRPLVRESHQGVLLDVCLACHGMWFDRGELEAYWKASRSVDEPPPVNPVQFKAGPGDATLVCPSCLTDALAVRRIDVFSGGPCSGCLGVWLGPSQEGWALLGGGSNPLDGASMVLDALEAAVEFVFGIFDGT